MSLYNDKNTLIKWMVLLMDAIVVVVCLWAFVLLCPEHSPRSVINHVPIAATLMLVTFFLASIVFPHVIHRRVITLSEIFSRNLIVVVLSQTIFALLWHSMTRNSDEEMIFNFLLCVTIFLSICFTRLLERSALRTLRSKGRNTRSVIFVGNDPANLAVYNEIMIQATTGYIVQGYYSDSVIEDAPAELHKLGSREDLRKALNGEIDLPRCDEFYCSLSHDDVEDITQIMKYCNTHIARFFYVPRMLQNIQLSLKPMIVGNTVLFTNFYEKMASPGNRFIKRAFDILFSAVVCLCILPFIPFIAFMVKRQSKGPVFFTQMRTGLDGKNFLCYKFRSMHVNAEADTLQATEHDPRKFPFGDFMRRTNIDELPQFFNVLLGDMSVVGPRPHMVYHTEKYSALLEKYMMRHFAKPGVTGLAQVSGYRGETTEISQMEGRIKKDIYYIENWSLWFDLRIIFKTIRQTIFRDALAF